MALMDGKLNEARFALILEGEGIPMEEITKQLGLTPTRVIQKGDLMNRLPEIVAEKDQWVYAIALTHPMGRDPELNVFLRYLIDRRETLHALGEACRVFLRMYVQSDYAQTNYMLTHETIKCLDAVGLRLEVSSLSWGETGL